MRCSKCYMPDTRPGSIFIDGVCQACRNYEARETVDWKAREAELYKLCDHMRGLVKPYDCLIPVSGGKDSHTLCHILVKELNMNPLLCTVNDGFTHTKAGTANLSNLLEKFNLNHWQYTISLDLFRRATRIAFEETGEPLKFIEYAIYTMPVKLAQAFHIPLVIFGENSAYEYGSTDQDTYDANPVVEDMTATLIENIDWWVSKGLAESEVRSIIPSGPLPIVIYMSYFRPWSSMTNLAIAKQYGFKTLQGEWEREGTIENFEQMDSYGYMVHLWMKYPKFGFQRVSDTVSRRIREGHLTLEAGKVLIETFDRRIDPKALDSFCTFCGYTYEQFYEIARKHDTGCL